MDETVRGKSHGRLCSRGDGWDSEPTEIFVSLKMVQKLTVIFLILYYVKQLAYPFRLFYQNAIAW
jgi:hypothetical protein